MDDDILRRYLYQTADQLGPNDIQKLPSILQNRLTGLYSTLPFNSPLLKSYEQLFQYLLETRLIHSGDITLLQYILEDLGKSDLLYPFYELVAHSMTTSTTVEGTSQDTTLQQANNKKNITSEFLLLLIQIGHALSTENVRTMAYLLQDSLCRYKAASINDGVELLELVYTRHYITSTHPCFLLTLLKDINREDLCCLVEQYKLTNNISYNNPATINSTAVDDKQYYTSNSTCCSFLSNFKKKPQWTRREYRFRLAMKKMSDVLNPRDFDNMKLLSQSRLPAALINKSDSILELFWLLEDHGHLSIDDLSFLEDLLDDRSYLIDSIYSQLSSQPASRENSLTRKIKHKVRSSTVTAKPEEISRKSFQKMLKLVGNGLTLKDTKHLKLLTDATVMCSEKIKTGVDLVSYWQQCNLITQNNVELLRKGLCAIGRTDLCTHISEYNCIVMQQQQCDKQHTQYTTPLPQEESTIITSQQCTEDLLSDGGHQECRGSILIERQKEEIAILRQQLHQSKLAYKQLERQNHSLLLHNHELTLEVDELQKQINITTLTRSASKNGIFLTTPV